MVKKHILSSAWFDRLPKDWPWTVFQFEAYFKAKVPSMTPMASA